MDIYPTHSCFDDCNENLIKLMKYEENARDLIRTGAVLVVHGIIAPYGYDMAHGWLELKGQSVIFTGIFQGDRVMITAELASWYAESKIKLTKKYTIFEARLEELRTGHFGPWVPEIRRLCPDVAKGAE